MNNRKRHSVTLLLLCLCAVISLRADAAPVDLLVPAIVNPCCGDGPALWTALATAAADPTLNVNINVVFNPAVGPGTAVDPNYLNTATGAGPLKNLRDAGAIVYGYVTTQSAAKLLTDAKDEIDRYFDTLYPGVVQGIYLDAMSNDLANVGYYVELRDYVKGKRPGARVIGKSAVTTTTNPSSQTVYDASDYASSVDILVTFENTGAAYAGSYLAPSWVGDLGPQHFAHFVHTRTTIDAALVTLFESRKAGLVYVTDDILPTPYDRLPSWWTSLLSHLSSHNDNYRSITNYTASAQTFPNPERGFYRHTETHSDTYTPLSGTVLQNYRQNDDISLVLRVFYLEDFVAGSISQTYLDKLQTDFNTLRTAGLKAVVRFAYTDQLPNPASPPWGDASKAQVLAHITQLQPYLQANADVIAAVQAGFIGIWGEWYYTDHFVADPASPGAITATDYGNRGDMLSALLTALPASRMAQLRTPHYKHQIYSVYTGTPPLPIPLTQFEAHGGTDIARTGHHNDCFLASADDFGTYNAGWASIAEDKTYLGEETRFVPMGGETCNPNPPRSECASALTELALLHWSYLNIDYHPDVIGSWVTGSCFGEIENRLGYRFTLVRATYDDAVETGAALNVRIELRNDGWAAPFNPRPVNLVLRHNYSGSVYSFPLANADPRFWEAGDVQILDYDIPVYLPSGKYTLLLHLPDPESSIATRPEYALRLANNSAWEAGTGYNVLGHTLDVFDPTLDTDGDGTLDIDDDDDDDDLLTDTFEENNSLDPLDPDTDGDMIMDGLDDAPGVFSNLCNTLGSNDAVFENVTVSSGTSVTCAAVNSVQIEPTLSIESGGTARVVSPSIRFANTFQIPTGGEITIDSRSPMP